MVGLSGIPFTNVFNACATAASAAKVCADGIRLGDYDIGIAVGLDKHPRGAFTEDPALVGMPSWYAENGQYLTTQFFGMKANRYLHDHGISQETLAKVAAKNFRNGALNPNAFRRKPIAEEDILNSAMLNYPLTQYMFCAPDEGAAAVVMCRADIAAPLHVQARVPAGGRGAHPPVRRLRGQHDVRARRGGRRTHRLCREGRLREGRRGTGGRRRDPVAGHRRRARRSSTWPSAASAPHGDQEKLLADGATEIHGSMPVNTDGGLIANGEPIGASGLRQIHELVRQLRGEAGDRQVRRRAAGRLRPALRRARHRGGDDRDDLIARADAKSATRRGLGLCVCSPRKWTDRVTLPAEIIHMAECGFCAHGDQEKLLADGATEIHGALPINTDGGLIANGEPIGASGLRQIHELVRQLRGEAGDRQVTGEPKVGFAQLYGAPGTAAATILTT